MTPAAALAGGAARRPAGSEAAPMDAGRDRNGNTEVVMAFGRLVVTRKIGEAVMVGDDVEVTVTELRQGRVRLCVTAPKGMPVHRLEVWRRIARERRRAAAGEQQALDLRSPNERASEEAA